MHMRMSGMDMSGRETTMKSARINLLLSPEEKALVESRAHRAGLTTSELVRRAIMAFDPDVDMEELEILARELALATDRMDRKLTETLEAVAGMRGQLADTDRMKAEARADLEASGEVWPFDLPEGSETGERASR
jgi:hypothetical protein